MVSEHLTEQLLAAILDTAVDPIIVIDERGVIQRANAATTNLLGYRTVDLVGKNVSMLMPEPFRSEHDSYLSQYLKTGKASIIGVGRDVIAERSDGTTVPVALAVSEVWLDGDHRFFTGIIHDLTRRIEAEQALEAANRTLEARVEDRTQELRALLVELERSNRDLEQFAYIASHDLQAPLRNVRQGLELLNEHLGRTVGVGFDDEATELQRLVTAAVTRMEELIRGLLEFSRVDRHPSAAGDPVDLDTLVDELRELLHRDIVDADAALTSEDLPIVHGDRVQLRQVLQNLVQNSLKYHHEEVAPHIEITATEEPDAWIVAVADNGIGIDETQHDRIFELFRRGHSGFEGVGLGLAVAQRIVERHDGRIWVESSPGRGATFHILLPKPGAGS